MTGQVLVHPSHLCQIGESDQGRFDDAFRFSRRGRRLLPALPQAWPKGTIEGVLCRGAIEIDRLHWDGGKVEAEMTSKNAQQIALVLPRGIAEIKAEGASVSNGANDAERMLALPAGKKVSLTLRPK